MHAGSDHAGQFRAVYGDGEPVNWIEEEKNLTNEEFARLNLPHLLPSEYYPYGEFVISHNLMHFIETIRIRFTLEHRHA